MSPWTQVKVLRALQDKRIRRVGGTEEIPVNVRIIAATNQDLKQKIEEGTFREDLYYRLHVISFEMPPLRRRKEDIPLLVTHFLKKFCSRMGKPMKRVAPDVIRALEAYPWPGNVRELENVIERIVAIEDRQTITKDSLPKDLLGSNKKPEKAPALEPGFRLNAVMDDIASNYVRQALEASRGNLKQAALLLGINYRSLRYLIDKYGLRNNNKTPREAEKSKHVR
ncbi:MAG: sigma 54-interacting transcriptional regulator [Candidatus Aminicenantales bacterium]